MGFAQTINAVIESLPRSRQTLLYSATQTQSVKDLARLSLQNPVYVSVHADALHSTPAGLKQRYVVCELFDKLNILYSFVRNHLKCKTLVFLSSCKQVQYYFSVFCRLRPGIPVMHLHGRMNQQRRLSVYQEFSRKAFALLLSTDLAARGLDFPNIDWVLQVDCPENPRSYIHRVGRTARFHGDGNALLMLLPSEKTGMLQELQKVKVPVSETVLNTNKTILLNTKLQSFCAEDKELKEKAQRCFKAYIRSVHLMKNKRIFSATSLPLEKFALSLGLACPPRVRFLQQKAKSTNANEESESGTKVSSSYGWIQNDDEDQSDLFTVKPDRQPDQVQPIEEQPTVQTKQQKKTKTKIAEAKRQLKKGMKLNQKIKFDESGDVDEVWPYNVSNETQSLDLDSEDGIDIEKAKLEMASRDAKDRLKHKQRVQEKHKEARKLAKQNRRQAQSAKESRSKAEEDPVFLGGADDDIASSDDTELDSDQSVDEEDFYPPKKQPRIAKQTEISAGFSLADEEDLAMRLLTKSSSLN
uniref:ATP-dependent RNA helicase n=1 Tax=Phallusia mammillata TaxID=59560 RepID=A0A6F9DBB6_9ASCI|nr:probable ATP-dependent RNA helicase DDX10 [Phallusia mammillata]